MNLYYQVWLGNKLKKNVELNIRYYSKGSDKIIKLAPSIFQPPMKPTTSMTSNMSAATTSAATNVTAPPTIGAPLDQYVQKQQPQNTTNTQTNRMSAATTPTPIQMQTGAPQPSCANPHYTTTSLPAMRITQKSLKAYAKVYLYRFHSHFPIFSVSLPFVTSLVDF